MCKNSENSELISKMLKSNIISRIVFLIVIFSVSQSYVAQSKTQCKTERNTQNQCAKSSNFKEITAKTNAVKSSFSMADNKECPKALPVTPNAEQCKNEFKMTSKALPIFDMRFDDLPQECLSKVLPKNCAEATACTRRSGFYKILVPSFSYEPFYVECDAETEGGDWIVVQRRQDGSVDFLRNWTEYEKGFGDMDGEFFIGLKKLYALTHYDGPQELLILMQNVTGESAFAKYNAFVVGNDTGMYELKKLGMYSGTAGDSLTIHVGMKFSTIDRDNDLSDEVNCAKHFTGAWWYRACHGSNLNGKYGGNAYGVGINWLTFTGPFSSLTYVQMMLRRRRC